MGIRNPQIIGCSKAGLRPHNPSWGFGTQPLASAVVIGNQLITPHGDSEPTLRLAGHLHADLITPHGDSERATGRAVAHPIVLITPHGDSERGSAGQKARIYPTHNPSWGFGTEERESIGIKMLGS